MVSKNIYDIHNIYYLIIVSLLIIVIIYLIYKYFDKTKTVEGFFADANTDNNFSGLDANPLIDRVDGSNIIASPSSSGNFLIGSSTNVAGWKPTSVKNSSLVVNLLSLKRVKYIVVTGIRAFRVFFSTKENDAFSYEEVLYQTKNNIPRDNNPTLFFEVSNGDFNKNTIFGNLTTADGKPIFASYIKIVPINFTDLTSELTSENRTGSPFDSFKTDNDKITGKGMKLEIFGFPNDAKPDTTGESLSYQMFDETGKLLKTDKRWVDKTNKADPRIRITFTEPKQINSLVFSNQKGEKFVAEFSVIYKLNDSDISKTINNIKGNSSRYSKSKYSYYFNTPIVASELIIKPTKFSTEGKDNEGVMYIDDIKGFSVNKKQITAISEKTKKQYCSAKEDGEAGSVSELLTQQTEIQQLCDSLELQDQIKDNNQRIQKNKQYLSQLEEQDKKIVELEKIVEKMKHIRAIREKNNDHKMVDQELKQNNIEAQLSQLVEDRKKNMKQLNINLRLNSTLPTTADGSDAALTPITEGFANYQQQPYETSQNMGFYYRPYDDSTIQTQIIESSQTYSPDLRLFNQNKKNIGYQYERVSPMDFYENKAMKCTSGCDTNAKFITKM
jgi:hypothetical protein